MFIHPARFNEASPVRAADLNDLATDHEVLLGDVARANLPVSSPIWNWDFGDLYKDLAMWHRARYLWLRITGRYADTTSGFWATHTDCYPWWSFTVNGVEVVRRQWQVGWAAEHTWTETIDLSVTNPHLVMGKMYDGRLEYWMGNHAAFGWPTPDPTWIHLKAIYQRESI